MGRNRQLRKETLRERRLNKTDKPSRGTRGGRPLTGTRWLKYGLLPSLSQERGGISMGKCASECCGSPDSCTSRSMPAYTVMIPIFFEFMNAIW